VQELASRHLALKPLDTTQYDTFDKLPDRPIQVVPPSASDDPIALIIENTDSEPPTGSIASGDGQ
jgi:hypothetical protein